MKPAKQIYAENITWEESETLNRERRAKLMKAAAISGWTIAILETLSVAPLMHFQHIVSQVLLVDKATGDYRVERDAMAVVAPTDPMFSQRAISDASRYVKAHEGFSRAEADTNYKTVWLMSAPELRGQWDAYYKPDLNKQAPLNTMQPADSKKLENLSFSFLPTSEPGMTLLQVRYDLITQVGQLPPTTQRKLSTVTFKYDKANVPENPDDNVLNAFGFEAVNYRADEDGPVRQLTPAGAQQGASTYPQQAYGQQSAYSQQQYSQPTYPQPAQLAAANGAGAGAGTGNGLGASVRQGLQNLMGNGSTK